MQSKKPKPSASPHSACNLTDAVQRRLESKTLGSMAASPTVHCGAVIAAYASPVLGHWKTITTHNVADHLDALIESVKNNDLSDLEAILVSQTVALQAMFANLANGAACQKSRDNREWMTNMALKAAGQCRATITALADLKSPRSTIFAQQANVAHGHQQVNNGCTEPARARARKKGSAPPNKLIAAERLEHGSTPLDTRAESPSGRTDPSLEALELGDRPQNRRGQGRRSAER